MSSADHAPTQAPILDVDLGNTRMKYRYGEQVGAIVRADMQFADVAPSLTKVRRVRVASVLSDNENDHFAEQVESRWGCRCEFAVSGQALAGVTNGYDQPETLGVDRWLALVAGYHQYAGPVATPREPLAPGALATGAFATGAVAKGVLVVDLGTAATLDYVAPSGQHLGGYIVPGADLMCRSLLQQTSLRYTTAKVGSDLHPGRQTRDAVERGALLALVQLIHTELERFNKLCDHNARLVLCGGGVAAIERHLNCDYRVVPELVLDGLALALP